MSSYIETTGAYGPIQMSSVQEQPSSKIRVCKIFKASYISPCWSYKICAINPSNIQDFFCTFLALKPISMTGLWQGKGSAVLLKTFEHPRKGLQIKVFRHEELFLSVVFILISSKSVDNFLVLWHLWKLQFLLFLLLLIQAAVLRLLWVKEEKFTWPCLYHLDTFSNWLPCLISKLSFNYLHLDTFSNWVPHFQTRTPSDP